MSKTHDKLGKSLSGQDDSDLSTGSPVGFGPVPLLGNPVTGTKGNDFVHVSGDGLTPPAGYKDNPHATDGIDVITMTQGGNDIVYAGDQSDYIYFGATLTAADKVNGQGGNDTLFITGDYSAGLTFASDSLSSVEYLTLGAGFNYKLTVGEGNLVTTPDNGEAFHVDASALGAANTLNVNLSAIADQGIYVTGGAGNDIIFTGNYANSVDLTAGGNDTVRGGIGLDYIYMGGTLTAADKINGGGGPFDTIFLSGDYSAGLVFGATTLTNVRTMNLAGGHSYKLIFNDAMIAKGGSMTFDGSALGASDKLTLNGSAEKNGAMTFLAGAGTNTLTGGQFSNVFYFGNGGTDIATGGKGNDQFTFGFSPGTTYTTADHINGGGGDDLAIIGTTGTQALILGAPSMQNIATLQINGGDYTIKTLDNLVGAGKTMSITMLDPNGTDPLNFNGSAETDGAFHVQSESGADRITTGAGNDTIEAHGGADIINPGAGSDTLVYDAATDSTSVNYDTIVGFDFANDKFDLPGTGLVTSIDTAITKGRLTTANFDAKLEAITAQGTAHQLNAGHAVLFTPDSGELAGKTFLIVNADGAVGYNPGTDYVIELNAPKGTLHTTDFI
ncbi:MAG TPA: calcium-binding protein [Rhizomicrobium sp.]|jgi:Ca2+-binding RTX toxin-like protein